MKKVLLLVSLVLFISSCSNEFEFTKENVESTYKVENRSLNLEGKNIKNFVNLNSYMSGTEVNNIFVWNNEIQLIDVSWFEKLWKLDINNNDIRFIWDLKLPEKVRHLNLSNNNLDSLKWLEKYTNLKTIDLSYNNLEDEDLIFDSYPRLKFINIEWNNVSEEMLETIDSFNARYLLNNEDPYADDK